MRRKDHGEKISEVDFVGAEVDSMEKLPLEPKTWVLSHFLSLVCIHVHGLVHWFHF